MKNIKSVSILLIVLGFSVGAAGRTWADTSVQGLQLEDTANPDNWSDYGGSRSGHHEEESTDESERPSRGSSEGGHTVTHHNNQNANSTEESSSSAATAVVMTEFLRDYIYTIADAGRVTIDDLHLAYEDAGDETETATDTETEGEAVEAEDPADTSTAESDTAAAEDENTDDENTDDTNDTDGESEDENADTDASEETGSEGATDEASAENGGGCAMNGGTHDNSLSLAMLLLPALMIIGYLRLRRRFVSPLLGLGLVLLGVCSMNFVPKQAWAQSANPDLKFDDDDLTVTETFDAGNGKTAGEVIHNFTTGNKVIVVYIEAEGGAPSIDTQPIMKVKSGGGECDTMSSPCYN